MSDFKTKLPLVSVLIPCYNAEKWIAETLDSVLAQTWPNIEIVVVNDGSTDNSREVLKKFESRGVKVLDQENCGQTAAFNHSLLVAKGDYIQYLDADDLLDSEKIFEQVVRLEENPGCIATGKWTRFKSFSQNTQFMPDETWCDLVPLDWLVSNWRAGGGMMYPAMWLLPRGIVEAGGPWNEQLTLANDTEYFTRVVLASKRVLFCEKSLTYYRSFIEGSLSGLKSSTGWKSQFRVIELCSEYLLSFENSDRTRRVCSMLWQRFAHASYPYYTELANKALTRASSLHAAKLVPEGGNLFKLVSVLVGWKIARRLQVLSGRP